MVLVIKMVKKLWTIELESIRWIKPSISGVGKPIKEIIQSQFICNEEDIHKQLKRYKDECNPRIVKVEEYNSN